MSKKRKNMPQRRDLQKEVSETRKYVQGMQILRMSFTFFLKNAKYVQHMHEYQNESGSQGSGSWPPSTA